MARPRRLTELSRRVLDRVELPDGPLVVALSGGPDSAVCAWAAVQRSGSVRAVHVDHGLPPSARLRHAASAVAGRLGIPLEVREVEAASPPRSEGRARQARYALLLAGLSPGEWLLTGHTADDQAETVLINLLRGSGSDGLGGIPPRRPPVARPLLEVWRSETRELSVLLDLPVRDDPLNQDLDILRNRLRLSLIPHLESSYASDLRRRLARTASLLHREREVLDRAAAGLRLEVATGKVRIPLGELRAAEPVVAGRAVRDALARLAPGAQPTFHAVQQVLAVAGGGGGADLAGGVRAERVGPWLVIGTSAREASDPPEPARLAPPGSVRWGRFRVEAWLVESRPVFPLSPWALAAPLASHSLELEVRAVRAEDRIELPGGSKGALQALSEARVAPGERRTWPVVAVEGRVVWIPGVRRAPVGAGRADRYLCAVASEETEWEASAP